MHFLKMSELKYGGKKGANYQVLRNQVTSLEDTVIEVEAIQFGDGSKHQGYILPVASKSFADASASTQPNNTLMFYEEVIDGRICCMVQWKTSQGVKTILWDILT